MPDYKSMFHLPKKEANVLFTLFRDDSILRPEMLEDGGGVILSRTPLGGKAQVLLRPNPVEHKRWKYQLIGYPQFLVLEEGSGKVLNYDPPDDIEVQMYRVFLYWWRTNRAEAEQAIINQIAREAMIQNLFKDMVRRSSEEVARGVMLRGQSTLRAAYHERLNTV